MRLQFRRRPWDDWTVLDSSYACTKYVSCFLLRICLQLRPTTRFLPTMFAAFRCVILFVAFLASGFAIYLVRLKRKAAQTQHDPLPPPKWMLRSIAFGYWCLPITIVCAFVSAILSSLDKADYTGKWRTEALLECVVSNVAMPGVCSLYIITNDWHTNPNKVPRVQHFPLSILPWGKHLGQVI